MWKNLAELHLAVIEAKKAYMKKECPTWEVDTVLRKADVWLRIEEKKIKEEIAGLYE